MTRSTQRALIVDPMQIQQVHIKSFRLLMDVELLLAPETTLIVGRNNSGKTAVAELFRRLLDRYEKPSFVLADFSLGSHEKF